MRSRDPDVRRTEVWGTPNYTSCGFELGVDAEDRLVTGRARPARKDQELWLPEFNVWRAAGAPAALARLAGPVLAFVVLLTCAGTLSAQTWTPEQQELWKLEEKQWQMAKDKDLSGIESMVRPNLSYWSSAAPVPQTRASLARWNRYENDNNTVLEQELYPHSITIPGGSRRDHLDRDVPPQRTGWLP